MRFIEDGPSIPDELLNARDEGRVVFFCGAGVSLAYAKLPDFFGLADAVIKELGVEDESDARKVLKEAREIGKRLSITGLISADRVFGFLEREFTTKDIQAAVSKSLKSNEKVDLRAHQLLLRLSGDTRRHAISMLSDHLGWFYRLAPVWTEQHFLSILKNGDNLDRESLWAGFL